MGIFKLWDMAMQDSKQRLEQQRMANEIMRRQLDAQSRLGDMVGETTRAAVHRPAMPLLGIAGTDTQPGMVTRSGLEQVPVLNTPQGQRDLMGVAADLAPGQVVQQMMGGNLGGRATERYRLARQMAGEGLIEPDMIGPYTFGGGSQQAVDPMEAYLAMLLGQQRETDLEKSQREAAEAEENRKMLESDLVTGIDDLITLGELNGQLSGTLQETGILFPEARQTFGTTIGALGKEFGFDTSDFATDAAAKGAFNKYATRVQFDLFKDEDPGSNAARIAERFFKGTVGEIGSAANDLVIADQIEGRLRAIDIKKIPISQEERAKAEAAIQFFRARGLAGTRRDGGNAGADYQFTPEGELIQTGGQ